jgi:DNA-nicking Smr family endonuclease
MEGRSRKRFLSEEEIELWAHVTRHDEPLERQRPINASGSALTSPQQNGVVPAAAQPSASPAKPAAPPPKTKPALPPPHAPFDPRVSKRLARGRHEIDARLDLHGMRQQDAYVALRRFLARCQAQGFRHVLIITGKGEKPGDAADRDFWRAEERGVLRRLVPHWLAEPNFRSHVVSFTESALKHGGAGALYLTIRKSPRHQKHDR